MTTTAAPTRERQVLSHAGQYPACHRCGGAVTPDPDPRRRGWLACPACGPVYMPVDGRFVRVSIECSLEEASERILRFDLQLLKGGVCNETLDP